VNKGDINIKNNHLESCTKNLSHKKSALVRADIFFRRSISSQKIPLIEEHLLRDDNGEKKKTSPKRIGEVWSA